MKALALFSGGLDSILAAKLIQEQSISVVAIYFTSPFVCRKGRRDAVEAAEQLEVPLKTISLGEDYLRMLRNPKHGYGKNLNPCIDCRIFMLKKAKKCAAEMDASFIFTGEVLDERPMSQNRGALSIIEEEAGLSGKILRPLSARLLPETEAEKKRWVDREKLLDIKGRSRKKQIQLAEKFSLQDYPSPAGGCLLTCKEFAAKLRDLFGHKRRLTIEDVDLLKIGRHFRLGKNKIIVGRNETENQELQKMKDKTDYFFEVPGYGSPITLLQGPKTKEAVKIAAALTLRYSDNKQAKGLVLFGREVLDKSIVVSALDSREIEKLRID